MTRSLEVMPRPDPDTCSPATWSAYLESTNLEAMTVAEVDVHRGLVERYTRRLLREQADARAATGRLLDARDDANTEAETLSARCRTLHRELLDAGDLVLQARRDYPPGAWQILDAQDRYEQTSAELTRARATLAVANLRAIQTRLDAR